ncbi:hypothetical protein DFO55_11857 [Grimontella sp. AG753]|nr:hypothetical protein DFO55_11857 [Grimontella sp. AG753]
MFPEQAAAGVCTVNRVAIWCDKRLRRERIRLWPVEPLGIIADWRNDLVHRNGVDEHDVPRVITAQQLQNALKKVSDLIAAADMSLRLEIDYFGNWRNEENREIIASALRIYPGGESSR